MYLNLTENIANNTSVECMLFYDKILLTKIYNYKHINLTLPVRGFSLDLGTASCMFISSTVWILSLF